MEAQNTGVWIAMAAILVQAPRLVLAGLAADHQAIAATWGRALLVLAGCGTALVLTGGKPYLPPAIARGGPRRARPGVAPPGGVPSPRGAGAAPVAARRRV